MLQVSRMTTQNPLAPSQPLTVAQVRALSAEQRAAVLEAAAARAESDYRHDPALTAFEAFGKDDLCGDSSGTETR